MMCSIHWLIEFRVFRRIVPWFMCFLRRCCVNISPRAAQSTLVGVVMFSKVFISGTIFPLPVGIVRFSTMHIAYTSPIAIFPGIYGGPSLQTSGGASAFFHWTWLWYTSTYTNRRVAKHPRLSENLPPKKMTRDVRSLWGQLSTWELPNQLCAAWRNMRESGAAVSLPPRRYCALVNQN